MFSSNQEDVEVGEGASKSDAFNSSRPRHGETVAHDPSKDDRTVFVSNLPFKATETDLQRVFEPCGQIASVRPAAISVSQVMEPVNDRIAQEVSGAGTDGAPTDL
nr:unnamed protein product [Spirometra erinaceieuropaei]